MSTAEEKTATPTVAGFPDWLALYEYIKSQKLHNEDRITLAWSELEKKPGLEYPDDMVLDMTVVRSHCFQQLYDHLPLPATSGFLIHVIEESSMGESDKKIVLEFLKKLPTRTHG